MSPRIYCKKMRKRLVNGLQLYFDQTSLHGFRYILHPKSTKFKSVFWAIVCIISTVLCVILISDQLEIYETNRITTTIATTAFPVWQVPFPAVTICNFNVVYKENLEHFINLLEDDVSSTEIHDFFSNLSQLIITSSNGNEEPHWKNFKNVIGRLEDLGYNTDLLMKKLAQPCNKLLTACFWKTREINCNQIFFQSKTTSGYCCSFNYDGENIEFDANYEPIYGSGVGTAFSLEVHLDPETEQYVSSTKQSKGIDVILHQSKSYPDVSLYSTTIYPGSDVALSVKPEIFQSEEKIRKIDKQTRGCVFENEIKMGWSNSYSYSTCMNECKARAQMQICNCLPYYYPLKPANRYCTLLDTPCLRKNSAKFKRNSIMDDLFKNQTRLFAKMEKNTLSQAMGDAVSCKCFPQCNEVTYTYQIDQEPIKSVDSQVNNSILSVYFGQVTCLKIVRSIFMTWEIVLASIGGLIGLCLGGSILSIIELFYHIFDAIFTLDSSILFKKKVQNYEPKLYVTDFKFDKNNYKLGVYNPKIIFKPYNKPFKKKFHFAAILDNSLKKI